MKIITLLALCALFTVLAAACQSDDPVPVQSPPPDTVDPPQTSEAATEETTEDAVQDTGISSNVELKTLEDVYAYLETEDFIPPEGFDVQHDDVLYGELTEVEYFSETTGAVRKCYVYTPPGYDPDTTYPVLFLLHGIGGTHSEWLGGRPNEIISNLIAAGQAKPMIAVMPNVRAREDDSVSGNIYSEEHFAAFDNFINDLRDDLLPFIAENYPISERREDRAIAGLSMGGRESIYIGVSMPETFGYIGAFSAAPGVLAFPDRGYPGLLTAEQMTLPEEYINNTLVLSNNGDNDGVVGDAPLSYHQALEANGVNSVFYITPGGHDFKVWKNGLYFFAKCIFPG